MEAILVPVKYGAREYPPGVEPAMVERAAHFDSKFTPPRRTPPGGYSLHTEYAAVPRHFTHPVFGREPSSGASSASGPRPSESGSGAAGAAADGSASFPDATAPPPDVCAAGESPAALSGQYGFTAADDSAAAASQFAKAAGTSPGGYAPRPPGGRYPALRASRDADGVPELWTSEEWATEFAAFVIELCAGSPPAVVEIHPPFADQATLPAFIERYIGFEAAIRAAFPGTLLLIKNRRRSARKGRFLLSVTEDLYDFARAAAGQGLDLRFSLDLTQLLAAEGALGDPDALTRVMRALKPLRRTVYALHLWCRRWEEGKPLAYEGTLEDLFGGDRIVRDLFLDLLREALGDGRPRFFVPEVHSSDADLAVMVDDLTAAGFVFRRG